MRQRLLARFYDPFAAAGLREHAFAARMFELVGPSPHRILHVGCGRGWLTRAFAAEFPRCEVIGLDADPDILAGADAGPKRANLRFVLGRAEAPPVDGPFDAIVSSLLFHHVPRAAKRAAFARAAELLAPGGQLLIADFARPHDALMRVAYLPVQFADGFDDTADNLDGSYLRMMTAAGLRDAREEGHRRTPLGTVALYRATCEDRTGTVRT
jgi:ubiquinone/menaquinone biosynthesis C-methylase UbiE